MKNFLSKKFLIILLPVLILASVPSYANYSSAMQYFQRKDFVRSSILFFQSVAYPKSPQEKLSSEFYLAESLKNLQLFYSASKYYSTIVVRGPGSNNPFFSRALANLGDINQNIPLGQAHIRQLFKKNIPTSSVPSNAQGFYYYYLGVENFSRNRLEQAGAHFSKVPNSSSYYIPAVFHLGVILNLRGSHRRAIDLFERVSQFSYGKEQYKDLYENSVLNIARIYYEVKDFRRSIAYYGKLERGPNLWLEAVWESAWAFFIIEQQNQALGNIHTLHSPFFINQFYPESYLLQAITFLRLCRYRDTTNSLRAFQSRYKGVFKDFQSMMGRYARNPRGFFKEVFNYKQDGITRFNSAKSVLDSLFRTDDFKVAEDTIRATHMELIRLNPYRSLWSSSGLYNELAQFLKRKKNLPQVDAGRRLYIKARSLHTYLKQLSDQALLIQAEMLEGKLDRLRSEIEVNNPNQNKVKYAGGLQELDLNQTYEYWPFQGEWWEDELGSYVYNVRSQCRR